MFRQTASAIAWTSLIYVALVLQTGLELRTGPVFTAAVAAWALTSQNRFTGILWCAFAGFACDAAGADHLGVHLATYSVLAAVGSAIIPATGSSRGWQTVLTAAVIAGADRVVSMVNRFDHATRVPGRIVVDGLQTAGLTAGLVVAVIVFAWVLRRLTLPIGRAHSMQLSNRWKMLTE